MTTCPVCSQPTPTAALAFLHERVHEATWLSLNSELSRLPFSIMPRVSEVMEAYAQRALASLHTTDLPRDLQELIYRACCCQPTPEAAKNEPCACVAAHIIEKLEEWCGAQVTRAVEAERKASYEEGFNNGVCFGYEQLKSDKDKNRESHRRILGQHGWVERAALGIDLKEATR